MSWHDIRNMIRAALTLMAGETHPRAKRWHAWVVWAAMVEARGKLWWWQKWEYTFGVPFAAGGKLTFCVTARRSVCSVKATASDHVDRTPGPEVPMPANHNAADMHAACDRLTAAFGGLLARSREVVG